jgi:hypothetical protein
MSNFKPKFMELEKLVQEEEIVVLTRDELLTIKGGGGGQDTLTGYAGHYDDDVP